MVTVSIIKELNIKDVMLILHKCWQGMSATSIKATWDKAFGSRKVEEE